jgi:type IV pilus assembly protein PilA
MNWYFEDNGVAVGPEPESALESRVRGKKLSAESLIWHPGLPEWQPLVQLRPAWLEEPKPIEAAPARPASKPLAPVTKPLSPALKASPAIAKPLTTKPAEEEPKPGLLKRLFGLGKKKS